MNTKQLVTFIFVAVILSGCSANWHLKRSSRHELIAISKGAKIEADTVYVNVPVYIKEVSKDTLFLSQPGDTVLITKDRLKVVYIDLPGDSVFISAECDSIIKEVKVPVTIDKVIQAPDGLKFYWFILIGFVLAVIFGIALRR